MDFYGAQWSFIYLSLHVLYDIEAGLAKKIIANKLIEKRRLTL